MVTPPSALNISKASDPGFPFLGIYPKDVCFQKANYKAGCLGGSVR